MKKGKIIALVNQKGGVCKTTSTFNLGACLTELGRKVLAVDLDSSGNLTKLFGNRPREVTNTIADLILCEIDDMEYAVSDYIRESKYMHYIPCNKVMSKAATLMVNAVSRELILQRILAQVKDMYDYILLDCGPTLEMTTINALSAADSVIIPMEAESFAFDGLELLLESILLTKKKLNPLLDIEGVFFTKVAGLNIHKKYMKLTQEGYGEYIPVYEYFTPDLTEAKNAIDQESPLIDFKSKGRVAEAYRGLAKEVVGNEQ